MIRVCQLSKLERLNGGHSCGRSVHANLRDKGRAYYYDEPAPG